MKKIRGLTCLGDAAVFFPRVCWPRKSPNWEKETMISNRTLLCNALLASTLAVLAPGAQARSYNVIYSFGGATDGQHPEAAPTLDRAGNLYGTTYGGGAHKAGTVFKIAPDGAETVLHSFNGREKGGGSDGPQFRVTIIGAKGGIYGTTVWGGTSGYGTIWRLKPNGH